jgi:3-hydroxyisobutyrate dehydrogenase-like beta-hydroxyacid dehydrogenase
MGEPMIGRLLGAGYTVRVHARDELVRRRLASAGAYVSSDVPGAVAECDICIVCVFSDAQLEELALGPGGIIAQLPPHAILVSHVTSSLASVRKLETVARQAGIGFVDAPISGTSEAVRRGELTVMISGGAPDLRLIRPVLQSYASTVHTLGPTGRATVVKLVNNLIFAAHAQIAEAAAEVAERAGISRTDLVSTLQSCSGDSGAFAYMRRNPQASLHAAIPFLHKDVGAARESFPYSDLGYFLDIVGNGPLKAISETATTDVQQ